MSGLLIAALGLYGIVASAVAHRTPEVGLRIALGADPAGVLRMMAGRPAAIALGGAVVGIGTASVMTGLLNELRYGESTLEPWVLGGATLILFAVAGLASWIPARRATRIPPTEALRAD
jgi:ABC-type antimicrobial peptide transport system permease subunit